MEAICKGPHHRLQNLPIALVRSTFRLGLKFSVELKNGGVGQALAMSCEHRSQGRQNPRLPVNQSAVAVKADGGEAREIHGICSLVGVYSQFLAGANN